jgi:DNA-binding transcriptional LysR family regulator
VTLFANQTRSHRGPGRQYVLARSAQGRRTLNSFAEALAETGTITAASEAIGISQQRGSQLLARIRKELGWQAK